MIQNRASHYIYKHYIQIAIVTTTVDLNPPHLFAVLHGILRKTQKQRKILGFLALDWTKYASIHYPKMKSNAYVKIVEIQSLYRKDDDNLSSKL